MTWEELYLQLGNLVAEMPVLDSRGGPITPEMNRWLGRAAHLVGATGDSADAAILSQASNGLNTIIRDSQAQTIMAVVFRALATAESQAPAKVRGSYVAVGAGFDALQAVGKVLGTATKDILIVDPYMGANVLSDFAVTAQTAVAIRLLSDVFYTKPATLEPHVRRWTQQFAQERPLEVRLSSPRALHDRLIIIDQGASVWSLTQSLQHFAGRSPASVLLMPPDVAAMKFDHYTQVWNGATKLP